MRLIFIPGFGEDPSIFDQIHPHIPGEKVFVHNWDLIGYKKPRPELTVYEYAKEVVEKYGITAQDVVIGHSMGGWIAWHIKQLVHCPIVQIASWTNPDRVVRPISNLKFVYWSIKRGLYFNPLIKYLLIRRSYRDKPSKGIFSAIFDRLRRGDKDNVVNQLRIVFSPAHDASAEKPDLRIHARRDTIIRFPKEPCHEVPGDHFTLHTHPEEVYQPIVAFLQKRFAKA